MIDFDNIRKNTFQIGTFRVEPTRNLLKKDSQTFPLEPKIMDVLCELASYPGEVIARYDLIQRIWKVDYGADESLTRAISVLRKTFRSGGANEKYIETISKNGYRLIAPVGTWEDDGSRLTAQPAKIASARPEAKPKPPESPKPPLSPPVRTVTPAPIAHETSKAAANPRKNLLALAFGTSTLALMALIVFAVPFGKGYFDAHTNAYESEIAELRDLTKVNPGALDTVDPITVREPFRGDVTNALTDFGRSVALLPFKDMSADGTKQYFADGMGEEILLELSAIDGLRIIGRSASVTSMEEGLDLRGIGKALEVSHLIDGSVRTMDERVRVSVQLIESASQTQLWGQSYDGALKDGLNLQTQIAGDIVSELNLLLALNEEKQLEFNLEGFSLSAAEVNSPRE